MSKKELQSRGRAAFLALALALVMTIVGTGRLAAQVSTASVEVLVTGTDGVPLPGVTVTLQNTETGLTRTEVTGEQGTATLPALPPGAYKAEFDLQGFSPVSQDGIALRVGQTVQVRATLSPAVTETITVSTTVPLVDVYKTDTSTNIVPEQIESPRRRAARARRPGSQEQRLLPRPAEYDHDLLHRNGLLLRLRLFVPVRPSGIAGPCDRAEMDVLPGSPLLW
ncbi:MAG TPA: carboxypeptidase-like regulatory domain-containing protein [Thermoanaerobaculia bacterium]|jgi:hypothetical protein